MVLAYSQHHWFNTRSISIIMADRNFDYDRNPYNNRGRDWQERRSNNRDNRNDTTGERNGERSFMERAGDEVASWFGDDDAERRREMDARNAERYRDNDRDRNDRYSNDRYSNDRYSNNNDRNNNDRSSNRMSWSSDDRNRYRSSNREDWSNDRDRNNDRRFSSANNYGHSNYGTNYSYANQYDTNDYTRESNNADMYHRSMANDPFNSTRSSENQRHDFAGQQSYFNQHFTAPYHPKGEHSGKGPKGYKRSDERIQEDVCERLMHHGDIDASEIDVTVTNGEVTLTGSVNNRHEKHLAEDAIESISGVTDVHNQLRVTSSNSSSNSDGSTTATTGTRNVDGKAGKTGKSSSTLPS